MPVHPLRIAAANDIATRTDGEYVLYWMIAARRRYDNAALEHAVALSRELGKPLLVFEPLRVGYRWANSRLHRFAAEGMACNQRDFDAAGVRYLAYLERDEGEGKGLLEALSERACVVVTDTFPCFFLPRMVASAARQLPVAVVEVDSNGLFPLRASNEAKKRAVDFRRVLQKQLAPHLDCWTEHDPLAQYDQGAAVVPREVLDGWPLLNTSELQGDLTQLVDSLPIDTDVRPASFHGGHDAAHSALQHFLRERLDRYADGRNHPDDSVASGLSPWLHWGHIGVHEVARAVLERDNWEPSHISGKANGSREGWWGASPSVESFLDELITWRELGFHYAWHHPEHYDDPDQLPGWALQSLSEHAGDEREHTYTPGELERAETYDEVWNAAQRQLVRTGTMHNYLRMLWGKKVLEWVPDRRIAIRTLIHLNNKYAVDGRDPNSYSGIFWVFGRFDRAWGPERPIFGKIRYMTSDSTKRKLRMKRYLERFSGRAPGLFDG